jgi:hypothetical protein
MLTAIVSQANEGGDTDRERERERERQYLCEKKNTKTTILVILFTTNMINPFQ